MGKAWQHGQSPVHWVRRREGRGMRSEPEHLVAQGREAPAPRRFPSPPPPSSSFPSLCLSGFTKFSRMVSADWVCIALLVRKQHPQLLIFS